MGHPTALKNVSDSDLLRRLRELVGQSRRVETDLIAHIGEVDQRRLYAREATPSMFAYCTERLHLSEAEAWLRILVARAAREHPALLAMLRDGRLHLSGIRRLAPHLTPDNRDLLLKRAAHKTRREVEELVAELAPRPDAPSVMRKLPGRRSEASARGLSAQGKAPASPELGPDPEVSATGPATRGEAATEAAMQPESASNQRGGTPRPPRLGPDPVAGPAERSRPATVEPLSPDRYRVQFTASKELRDKLERLQALMRASVPDGELAAVIDVAVTREIERLEARRFAKTKAPRAHLAATDTRPRSRHIPAAVKRAVQKRAGGRCTFRDQHGRRCRKRHDLEFHHRVPFGHGGHHSPENVTLLCRAHNTLLAEHDYGKEVMAQHRRAESRPSGRTIVPTGGSPPHRQGKVSI